MKTLIIIYNRHNDNGYPDNDCSTDVNDHCSMSLCNVTHYKGTDDGRNEWYYIGSSNNIWHNTEYWIRL